MPEQRVEVKSKTVNINDHGLQNKMIESAAGLDEYMKTLQIESDLAAREKAELELIEQTSGKSLLIL